MNGSNDNQAQVSSRTNDLLFPKVPAPLYGGCCDRGMRYTLFDNDESGTQTQAKTTDVRATAERNSDDEASKEHDRASSAAVDTLFAKA